MHKTYIRLCKKIPSLIIINSKLPSCINCQFFIKDKTNYPYDDLPNDKENGKCKLYGEKHIVTGEIEYLHALYCRKDSQLCGKNGTNYTEKEISIQSLGNISPIYCGLPGPNHTDG